jgi:hypothetical protein
VNVPEPKQEVLMIKNTCNKKHKNIPLCIYMMSLLLPVILGVGLSDFWSKIVTLLKRVRTITKN